MSETSATSKIKALNCRYDNSLSVMPSYSKTITAELFLWELQSQVTDETNKIKVFTRRLKALQCIHSPSAPRPYSEAGCHLLRGMRNSDEHTTEIECESNKRPSNG
jgi:hypothetical protein